MSIEQHIVTVRRQFTGESLEGTRLRLRDLADWSAPLPAAATSDQERVESHLLQAFSKGHGRHPLGFSEIIPFPDRLVLRLESPELLSAVLPLLPYRDGRRARHGVVDLRAATRPGGIELLLGSSGGGRVLLSGPRRTCDFAAVLVAHREAVEARQHVPLWTEDTPHDPPPPPLRRSRSRPKNRTVRGRSVDVHAASPRLASAMLRRLHMWERLTGDGTVTITSQPQAGGDHLAWTVERLLPQGGNLHDDAVALVLTDPVVGPGVAADINGHSCNEEECAQTFDSGRLTIRTVRSQDTTPARRRIRARSTSAVLHERQTDGRTTGEGQRGHVLQLVSTGRDERAVLDAAKQLAAAWALHGALAMVLEVEHRRGKITWRRSRLTGGSGAMFTGTADLSDDELEAGIADPRQHFDHIIMVKRQVIDLPAAAISPFADDHVVVADGTFPRETRSTKAQGGELQRHTTALTPSESAMAWMHGELWRFPYAEMPMTGLLLQRGVDERDPDSFDRSVDSELARHGMPVLGRLPQSRKLAARRTVLDDVPDDQRDFVMRQSAQIRESLGQAGARGEAITAALRQMWDL